MIEFKTGNLMYYFFFKKKKRLSKLLYCFKCIYCYSSRPPPNYPRCHKKNLSFKILLLTLTANVI